jgi:dihydrofolate reductase
MSRLTGDLSTSLDGFTGPNPRVDEPIGDEERDPRALAEGGQAVGVIAGRRTVAFWGADGPTGPARLPVVVVIHDPPADSPQDGVYRFVTGGSEAALNAAQEAAGDRSVTVMGGPDLGVGPSHVVHADTRAATRART